jgi:hypothetical protein
MRASVRASVRASMRASVRALTDANGSCQITFNAFPPHGRVGSPVQLSPLANTLLMTCTHNAIHLGVTPAFKGVKNVGLNTVCLSWPNCLVGFGAVLFRDVVYMCCLHFYLARVLIWVVN